MDEIRQGVYTYVGQRRRDEIERHFRGETDWVCCHSEGTVRVKGLLQDL